MISYQNIVPKTLHIVIHFFSDDTDFTGDYTGVDIIINNDLVTRYEDQYHDKGIEKAKGFADAVKILFPDCIISKAKIADYDY